MLYNTNTGGTSNQSTFWAEAEGNNVFMRAYGDHHSTKANISELGSNITNTSLLFYAGSSSCRKDENTRKW